MMNNTALLQSMTNTYNEVAFTHNYIFGFSYKGNIYMAYANGTDLPYLLKLDKASRGQGYALRFCPNASQKLFLLQNAVVLCSTDYFNGAVEDSKYNRGELFEKMVTEYYGQEWVKDNIPFTKAGDLKVGRISYQIKFEKATFCNEKSLAHLS